MNNDLNNNNINNINNNIENDNENNKNYINNNIDYNKTEEKKEINKPNKVTKTHIKIANIITILITVIYLYFLIKLFIAINEQEMAGFGLLGLIIYGPIGFVFINGLYGLWRLCEHFIKNKKFIGIKATVLWLIVCIMFFFVVYYSVKAKILFENKDLIENYNKEIASRIIKGTISSIEGEIVYIKENNKLTPYIVADNYYGFENNTLLVRKNVLNNPIKYIDDDLRNSTDINYSDSLVDKYLQSNKWINNFDNEMLNIINNTNLYSDSSENTEKLIRKFFIISSTEEVGFHSEIELEYNFKFHLSTKDWYSVNPKESVYDDDGNKINNWWLRRENNKFGIIYGGFNEEDIEIINTSYIRPAFTIKSNTKIKKDNDKWILDIK